MFIVWFCRHRWLCMCTYEGTCLPFYSLLLLSKRPQTDDILFFLSRRSLLLLSFRPTKRFFQRFISLLIFVLMANIQQLSTIEISYVIIYAQCFLTLRFFWCVFTFEHDGTSLWGLDKKKPTTTKVLIFNVWEFSSS